MQNKNVVFEKKQCCMTSPNFIFVEFYIFIFFQILQEGQWLSEVKDLNRRYGALPPINAGNTIKPNAMAFTVD